MLSAEPALEVHDANGLLNEIKEGSIDRFEGLLKSSNEETLCIFRQMTVILLSAEHPDRYILARAVEILQRTANKHTLTAAQALCILSGIVDLASKGCQLVSAAIEMLPSLLQTIQTRLWASNDTQRSVSGGRLIKGFLQRLLHCPLHNDNLLPLLLALREVSDSLNDQTLEPMLKKLEDVPVRSLPAAIYQTLYWCRHSTKDHRACFEAIFLVIEANASQVNIRECLEYVRLALFHEAALMKSFVRESNTLLRLGNAVSPCVLLLLLSCEEGIQMEGKIRTIERHICEATALRCLAVDDLLRTEQLDSDLSSWPNGNKILSRLVDIAQEDDERSVRALISLSLALLCKKVKEIISLGSELMKDLFDKFLLARETIMDIMLSQVILEGSQLVASQNLQALAVTLDSLMAIPAAALIFDKLVSRDLNVLPRLCQAMAKIPDAYLVHIYTNIGARYADLGHLPIANSQLVRCMVLFAVKNERCSPSFWTLFHRVLRGDAPTRAAIYSFLSKLSEPTESSKSGITRGTTRAFEICHANFIKILPENRDHTNWPLIVQNCFDGINEQLSEPLHLLLASMLSTGSEESEHWLEFSECMDYLAEELCNQIDWFAEGSISMTSQLVSRPIIIGLYDICLWHLAQVPNHLSVPALRGATHKLLEMRSNFISDIPETSLMSTEILKFRLAVELMERIAQPLEDDRGERLIASLLSIPWGCDCSVQDTIKLLKICQRYLGGESPTGSDKVILHHLCLKLSKACTNIEESDDLTPLLGEMIGLFTLAASKEYPMRDLATLSDSIKAASARIKVLSPIISEKIWTILKDWSCTSDIDVSIAKSLLISLFHITPLANITPIVCQVSRDILLVQGDVKEETTGDLGQRLSKVCVKAVSTKSLLPILATLLSFLTKTLSECDKLIDAASKVSRWSTRDASSIIQHVLKKLQWVATASSILCQAQITGLNHVTLMKCLGSLFKCTGGLSKVICASNLPVLELFSSLAQSLTHDLTRNIYELLPGIQQVEMEQISESMSHKKRVKKQKYIARLGGRIAREARLIPELIFYIESFERSVLEVASKFGVAIVKSFHRSTARDFRIQVGELDNGLLGSYESENGSPSDTPNTTTADNLEAGASDAETEISTNYRADLSLVISNTMVE